MEHFFQALLGITLVSLIPLVGLLSLSISKKTLSKYVHILVSFAIGALLGNSFLHLIPEIFSSTQAPLTSGLSIVAGILLFYSLEQFLHWHHGHDTEGYEPHRSVALINILGDSAHNFIDGILISGSFLLSPALGWTTVLAVILHEIPQEIADFSILLHAKWSIAKIIKINLVSALLAVAGLFVGFIAGTAVGSFVQVTLAVTAGGFIYIACTDLIPDIHQHGATQGKQRLAQFGAMLLGILLFVFL